MIIIAVVNPKGGQGKTTLCTHLGHAARRAGLSTLLSDFDSQASLSLSFPPSGSTPAADALVSSALFVNGTDALPESLGEGLQIIRADKTALGNVPSHDQNAARLAAARIRKLAQPFDVCVIDTKGSLDGTTTSAALYAADAIVCPFEVGVYEADALSDLWQHLKRAKTSGINPRMRVLGLLPMRVNTRSAAEVQALESLRSQLGDNILPTSLSVRSAVKQAAMKRVPVWQGNSGESHKRAGEEWLRACDLILRRAGALK
ncbi:MULTISPECIES: ParA family protein [Burkholderia]|uniref:ParA family protein n=1 Tax=Burkholderia TaxID=32008 RepID=UPI0005375A4C|nr:MULTISPECIES: ParA family protein [Burkholderia]KGV74454.1 cobQ/CobB/MinD/ParA nucleotide binding domain protein [Burkholderia pseudomallei MSHR4299]